MKLIIEIDLDGAAFDFDGYDPEHYADGNEVARILAGLANAYRASVIDTHCADDPGGALLDSNGNACGTVRVVAD